MPIKKAAERWLRKSKKNTLRNKAVLENIQYLVRLSQKAIDSKVVDKAKETAHKAIVAIDKAAQKGILKKNTAARKKSRLVRKLNLVKG